MLYADRHRTGQDRMEQAWIDCNFYGATEDLEGKISGTIRSTVPGKQYRCLKFVELLEFRLNLYDRELTNLFLSYQITNHFIIAFS